MARIKRQRRGIPAPKLEGLKQINGNAAGVDVGSIRALRVCSSSAFRLPPSSLRLAVPLPDRDVELMKRSSRSPLLHSIQPRLLVGVAGLLFSAQAKPKRWQPPHSKECSREPPPAASSTHPPPFTLALVVTAIRSKPMLVRFPLLTFRSMSRSAMLDP